MTDEEINSREIEESHQKRPFLIMEKSVEEEIVTGYYLTSNIQKIISKKKRYELKKIHYYYMKKR